MPIVSQGNSVVLDVGAHEGLWIKSTGSAEVTVNQVYAGTPEVFNVGAETLRVGFYGEPVTVSIRAVSGNADYQDTPYAYEKLTATQQGDRGDSGALDIAQAVNNLQNGAVGFDAITLKGLPQTPGAPAGYGDLASAVLLSNKRAYSNGVYLVDFPEKSDAGEWINDAITYAFNNKFDYVQLPNDGRSLIVNTTIRLRRGVALLGGAVFDNQNGTVLTRGANFGQPVIATDKWFEPANPVESHYYAINGICINGNKANNSVSVESVSFWGVFVGSYIDNFFVLDNFGPAISYSRGYDCKHGLVWVNGCTVGSRAAIEIDQTLTAAGPIGILEFDSLYVENTSITTAGGSPQTTATNRGDAIKAGNVGRLSVTNLHAEACDAVLNITHGTNDCVTIGQFSGAWLGDSARLNSYVYMSQPIRGIDVGKGRTTDKASGYKIIGVAPSVASSNQYKDISSSNAVFGGISISTLDSGFISNTIAYNNFTQEVVGGTSALSHRLQTSNTDATRYHYIKGSGSVFTLGSRVNQASDVDFITIDSFGNAGDRITLSRPVVLGQRSTAASVQQRSVYEFTDGTEVGPAYQRVSGSNAGADFISTVRRTNDTAAPTTNASYIGQIYMTLGTNPRQAYIAVNVGTGATDWRQIT